ncbi:unnamed protein product [Cochlearia groenlandica]
MGNGVSGCWAVTHTGEFSTLNDVAVANDNLGHSFCYVDSKSSNQPDTITGTTTTTFRSISGASVSANTSTTLSSSLSRDDSVLASGFESSNKFASLPLHPVPRGPVTKPGQVSSLFERRFLSGPIESGLLSRPTRKKKETEKPKIKSFSKPKKLHTFKTLLTNIISNKQSRSKKIRVIKVSDAFDESSDTDQSLDDQRHEISGSSTNPITQEREEEEEKIESDLEGPKVQWAQGKAGEDRVHVILSEENGWLFVGIYDGFSGPDPPDYLLNNLYTAVLKELEGLLSNDKHKPENLKQCDENRVSKQSTLKQDPMLKNDSVACDSRNITNTVACVSRNITNTVACDSRNITNTVACDSRNVTKLQWICNENHHKGSDPGMINHNDVLSALEQALKKTEEAFDLTVDENPELALMGSCVLVTLMRGEDVYVMSVGDSRAVLAQRPDHTSKKKMLKELERIKEEGPLESFLHIESGLSLLVPVQLNREHSTSVAEEVKRIKKEHQDDVVAIENDRVKGYLKVTRAFGAAFLKQPKRNEALLEMFRINYVGTLPYITCSPSLHHHRLTSRDKFIVLSSDGLYEYFSNEEAIFEVDSFISAFPEGDPAQHLIQEVLLRAAKKYGMDFHELVEIPQGDRRKYHDDVSVIVVSLEGRIWRSSM